MKDHLLQLKAMACLPLLIGSFPRMPMAEALGLVQAYTPRIPSWVQMPGIAQEGMVAQFASGFPGLSRSHTPPRLDEPGPDFDAQVIEFYEEYLAVTEDAAAQDNSRFVLSAEAAAGFFAFLEWIRTAAIKPTAVKGQITGPFSFGTGLKDASGRALFYDDQLRDMAVKLVAMKAAWQVRQLSAFQVPVILFIDEPSLAGFGSSEFISISRDSVKSCLAEVVDAIHAAGGIAGIHVCANTDWSMVMETGADVINFDAYSFFDRFILYADHIVEFFDSGRWLAWGMVPTLDAEHIQKETAASLVAQFFAKVEKVSALGLERSRILSQSLITPSCGMGSLSLDFSKKVLKLTRNVSEIIRKEVDAC